MTSKPIEEIALSNGFKLKEQPDGTMALNPYVFEFARELLATQAEKSAPSPHGELVAAAVDVLKYFDEYIHFTEYGFLRRLEHLRTVAEKSAPLSDTPEGYEP